MTPERFQQIEELYHAAREGTADERKALLAEAEPKLRREVELLLAQPIGGEFLDRDSLRDAPQLLEDPTATVLDAGACLGPYRIEGRLGAGGMGEVFRAVDTRLGRAVAIKITQERFSDRFEREARAIASLNHPNICTLHDVGPNYLVMELVEGETIAQRLEQGPMPVAMVCHYGLQIGAALAEAHAKGIIHRDLKPGNIMIAKSGVKVLDFGLAKSGQDETVTACRMVIGTPAYMAPEQREGKPADTRSDIYSLGCVLYEMSTGARVTSQRRRIPSTQLERIVGRCLEEAPERRWQSVAELERELAGVTATGGSGKRMLAAAAGMLGLFTAAAYFYFHPAPKLSDKDTIVLADFVNNTGDPIFDSTLRQGLAIQLEQSPFLKIMDDEQVRRVLRLMGLPPGARITNPIAHEICVRQGAAATVDGAVASLGKSYVITLQAIACQDGATLAREQIQAVDKEHVLNAVGSAATAVRGKLGESLNSIQKLNRPLEQATTPSLEALQNYTAGISEMNQGHFLPAVQLFERATAIDPNFAMAYYFLSIAFGNAGDMARSREYSTQAFRLIDRVSEYERDEIATMYYKAAGETDKAIDAFQLGVRNFPREWDFHNNLSELYIDLGQYEEGLKEGLEAARLQARVEPPYRRQLDAYICTDRLTEAKELAQKLRVQGLDGARIHQRFLEMAYVEDDLAAIAREIQWFAGKPAAYISLGLQAANRNAHGQRRESHKLFQRAAEAALREELRNAASGFEEADAQADALESNCQTVRRLGRPALALALCGDAVQAERLAAETSKLFPNGTIWNAVQLPEIRAAIALNRDQPAKSVELLASASPYEHAYLDAVYLRGLAYLRLRKGAEAAAEFQKIVDHKGANWASAWRYPYWAQFYSLSYLGMARGSALAGDTAKAKKAFQDFFELWREANQDLPTLQQAKAEYAKLR
ncbi:Serine/threonine protein kinase [Candidatus Sulfopaludibacter sp. SbA6]|nr:Serine/threonine protein kinase [Candidatus Sulfopaludibacter sp. SbA6]